MAQDEVLCCMLDAKVANLYESNKLLQENVTF